jgi:hypothetical protein
LFKGLYYFKVIKEERCNSALLIQYLIHDLLKKFEAGVSPFYLRSAITGGDIIHGELLKVICFGLMGMFPVRIRIIIII